MGGTSERSVSAGRRYRGLRDRGLVVTLVVMLVWVVLPVIVGVGLSAGPAAAADPCAAPVTNPVACENTKPGSPESEWGIGDTGSDNLAGFTTEFSVNVGETVRFKVKAAGAYTMNIFRMGYYQGLGARKMATVATTLRTQPGCLSDPATGLVDCGNWAESATWTVPATAVSGVYFAQIVRTSNPDEDNHIVFVVRDDSSDSDMLFQTSDTTWQAYNDWGGNSLYKGAPVGRAYKVSYNRPFRTRAGTPNGRDFVWNAEYPMIRFLERNGYDLSYFSGIDSDRRGALIRNHKIFTSHGHDEYWSGPQRTNVEAARDAGVNLAFFSGNEVFWKVRWEAGIDAARGAYRTMVTYKETHANAKVDPNAAWTGTWRDPRFPSGEKREPENSLTGTIFSANCCGYPMEVPAADGKMRFWRNTSIANLASGSVATLPDQTLGYEWDEDLDNGFRPGGMIRLATTTKTVAEKIQDMGSTVQPGPATHSLTLYRAASGALVFGAGTVQWAWGLDAEHDGLSVPTHSGMQQATVNLFADMGVQPFSLMSGLAAASRSTDTTRPSTSISAPAGGAALTNGNTVTISGTASDSGGRVGGVEVSTDGGATWHRANGRESWTYTWRINGAGAVNIKARATDDSLNTEVPGAGVTVNVACPCSLFGQQAPDVAVASDTSAVELGVRFKPTVNGRISGIRFYKNSGATGTHTGKLWSTSGTQLASATFVNETASGWQSVRFPTPVEVTAGTTYVASYFAPTGRYYATTFGLTSPVTSPPLTALADVPGAFNGLYRDGSTGFPTQSYRSTNYWVDVLFETQTGPDTTKPTVTETTPADGAINVAGTVKPSVSFSERIAPATLSLVVRDPAGAALAGTTAYDDTTRTATFTPSAALAASTRFSVTVSGARDLAATPNTMDPYTFGFTTREPPPPPGECPCSLWDEATVPATVSVNDPNEVELGVRFRADADGFVNGIRFYKGPGNTGAHTGTLWSATGTQLATGTFVGESASGWQEMRFASPVAVTAGTTYIASYHAPSGMYSATDRGLATARVNGPLTAPADAAGAGNGLYRYGARAFPNNSYSSENYFVDVVFTRPATGPDTTAPAVSSTNPASDAIRIPVGVRPAATFNEAVTTPGTFTLTNPAGAAVAGSAAYDATTRTITFTPGAALAASTRYTATVNGAKDAAGNTMTTAKTWSFTTADPPPPPGACPCSILPSNVTPTVPANTDTGAVELGVRFTADVNGTVTGLKFYKGTGNTGTHVGNLWSSTGALLASATFVNETATGWQTVTFATPVPVTAGVTYTASYHAPVGRYSTSQGFFTNAYDNAPLHALANSSGGNGVYRYGSTSGFPTQSWNATNYWVDVIFKTG